MIESVFFVPLHAGPANAQATAQRTASSDRIAQVVTGQV